MRRFKFVGNECAARGYGGNVPVVGKIYNEDVIIGENTTVLEWATESSNEIGAEWEEVIDERILDETQKTYYKGNKNWISCKIETVIDGKSVVSEFGTNDLEEFKKFVDNLI